MSPKVWRGTEHNIDVISIGSFRLFWKIGSWRFLTNVKINLMQPKDAQSANVLLRTNNYKLSQLNHFVKSQIKAIFLASQRLWR